MGAALITEIEVSQLVSEKAWGYQEDAGWVTV